MIYLVLAIAIALVLFHPETRHRFAKAVVVWFVTHSGTGALVEAEDADTKALIAGVRQDLGATQTLVRGVVETSNTTVRIVKTVLEKQRAWEQDVPNLKKSTARLIERTRRARKRAEAERELASEPAAPDPAIADDASGGAS